MLRRSSPRRALAFRIAAAAVGFAAWATTPGASELTVEPPSVVLRGVPFELEWAVSPPPSPEAILELRSVDGTVVERVDAGSGEGVVRLRTDRSGAARWTARLVRPDGSASADAAVEVRSVPGAWSLAPPILAIGLALVFRQVVPALLAGVWVGAALVHGGPFAGLLRTVDLYVVDALADRDHISIVVFSLLLGGMVGIVSRAGGTAGIVSAVARHATSPARGQVATWFMGIAVFFDDYANTLIVGNTMRPVTDRLRISREKLAYIVDSTAAPVAAIALVTTWIGAEVSYIADALADAGSDADAYSTFLRAIPYNFYPILALVFGFSIAVMRRDFGPMRAAERRALEGAVLREGAQPLADFDAEALEPVPDRPHRAINAVVPVALVVVVTLVAQWATGRASLAEAGNPLAQVGLGSLGVRGLGAVFSAGDSYAALLYGASAGCIAALVLARLQGILSIERGLQAWVQGMKSMLLAFVVLTAAWAIGAVCSDLHAADYVAEFLSGTVDPRWLPALTFVFAAATAFGTGTSWGTMGLLIPLAVPAAFRLVGETGLDASAADAVVLGTTSAVLAGAILGDHCSPISDTTVLSSMASGCDHVDHVRTQLPYALVVGAIAVVFGYVPTAFGMPVGVALIVGAGFAVATVRVLGRPHEDAGAPGTSSARGGAAAADRAGDDDQ